MRDAGTIHEGTAWLHCGRHRFGATGEFTSYMAPPEDSTCFYVNDFALTRAAPWRRFHSLSRAPLWEDRPADPPLAWHEPAVSEFAEVFREVMEAIAEESLIKAVPVTTAMAKLLTPPGKWLGKQLTEKESAGHGFLWDVGERGFGGLTPEILFQIDGRELRTMALAGTTDSSQADALLYRPKLSREHEIVVTEIRRRLQPLGKVECGDRQIVPLGSLYHLRTELRVTLREEPHGAALNDLVRLLHPTPALGIAPRAALSRLHGWRERLRTPRFFGAPFGIAYPGGATMLVAIRGLFWQQGELHLPAGCGLVAGSVLESEWAELQLKRAWVRRTFKLS